MREPEYSFEIDCPCGTSLALRGEFWPHLQKELREFEERHAACVAAQHQQAPEAPREAEQDAA